MWPVAIHGGPQLKKNDPVLQRSACILAALAQLRETISDRPNIISKRSFIANIQISKNQNPITKDSDSQ